MLNEIGGDNTYHFSPSRDSPEKNARAIVELLNNIGNPHYIKPGSILRMQSPTFERLCQYKVDWPCDGMLGVSQVTMAVTPVDNVQDMEYYDNYTSSKLPTGSKVWLTYPPLPDNFAALQAHYKSLSMGTETLAMNNAQNFQHGIAIVQQAGQGLVLPPFWIATSISTQTAVSCTYHVATATAFAERLKHLSDSRLTTQLWLTDNIQGQPRLVSFATEFVEHLQEILEDSFPQCNVGKVIGDICRAYETLRADLRRILDTIEDEAIVRGLENKYRAAWLKFLEEKRKKNPVCRLCNVRVQNMPAGGTPTDRLR